MSENTHSDDDDTTITFGKHEGKLFKDLPLGYLRWMVKEGTKQSSKAMTKIIRRGEALQPKKKPGMLLRRGYNTPRGYAE